MLNNNKLVYNIFNYIQSNCRFNFIILIILINLTEIQIFY